MISLSNIKLFISDLDGTLLDDGKNISDKLLESIKELMSSGVYFSINTGREYAMLEHYLRLLNPNCPIVSNNGAEVVKYPSNEVIQRIQMPMEETRKMISFLLDNKIDFCATTISKAYFPKWSKMTEFYRDYNKLAKENNLTGFPVILIDEYDQIEEPRINKMILRTDLSDSKRAIEFAKQLDAFSFTMSSELILEIMPKGMDKYIGLKKICEYLDITLEEVCVAGDYDNDLRCLSASGMSVAPENATDKIKSVSKLIVDSNNQSGLSKIINLIIESRKNEVK